jgi:hypothetical protein
MPLSILGTIFWIIIAIVGIGVLLLVLLIKMLTSENQTRYQREKGSSCLYSEHELEPGLWGHNDAIATIHIWEEASGEETPYPNADEAWATVSVDKEEIPDSMGDGVEMTRITKNGRKWKYRMYIPDRWDWLINLPLPRFLNDFEYREGIESKVNDKKCNSNIERLIACCLLHAPQYHTPVQEEGKTQEQMDIDQAEKLLLSSAKKGNLNAMYELICLYHEKGEYETVVKLNNDIKSTTGRGVWFVDRFEHSIYHIKKDS